MKELTFSFDVVPVIEQAQQTNDRMRVFTFNRGAVCAALKQNGITAVNMRYTGSGDEGWVDTVRVKRAKSDDFEDPSKELMQTPCPLIYDHRDIVSGKIRTAPLSNVLNEVADYAIQLAGWGGWGDGVGCEGNVEIDVASKKTVVRHQEYIEILAPINERVID